MDDFARSVDDLRHVPFSRDHATTTQITISPVTISSRILTILKTLSFFGQCCFCGGSIDIDKDEDEYLEQGTLAVGPNVPTVHVPYSLVLPKMDDAEPITPIALIPPALEDVVPLTLSISSRVWSDLSAYQLWIELPYFSSSAIEVITTTTTTVIAPILDDSAHQTSAVLKVEGEGGKDLQMGRFRSSTAGGSPSAKTAATGTFPVVHFSKDMLKAEADDEEEEPSKEKEEEPVQMSVSPRTGELLLPASPTYSPSLLFGGGNALALISTSPSTSHDSSDSEENMDKLEPLQQHSSSMPRAPVAWFTLLGQGQEVLEDRTTGQEGGIVVLGGEVEAAVEREGEEGPVKVMEEPDAMLMFGLDVVETAFRDLPVEEQGEEVYPLYVLRHLRRRQVERNATIAVVPAAEVAGAGVARAGAGATGAATAVAVEGAAAPIVIRPGTPIVAFITPPLHPPPGFDYIPNISDVEITQPGTVSAVALSAATEVLLSLPRPPGLELLEMARAFAAATVAAAFPDDMTDRSWNTTAPRLSAGNEAKKDFILLPPPGLSTPGVAADYSADAIKVGKQKEEEVCVVVVEEEEEEEIVRYARGPPTRDTDALEDEEGLEEKGDDLEFVEDGMVEEGEYNYSGFDELAVRMAVLSRQTCPEDYACPVAHPYHPLNMSLYDRTAVFGVGTAPHLFGNSVMHLDRERLRRVLDIHRYRNMGREPSQTLLREQDLGQGSFGWVFKVGKKQQYCQEVAVKAAPLANTSWTEEAFFDTEGIVWAGVMEVMALKRALLHNVSAVVKILGVAVEEGCLLIALEFAPNGTMGRLVKACNERLVRQYGLQMLKIVEDLNASGIVHRDMKPENFLLDESWRAVAADFGLAHVNEEGGPAGEIPPSQAGTNGFRAPELDGKTVYTYKCDLYSVGKTMVALVLGYGYVDMTREMIIRNLIRLKWSQGGLEVIWDLLDDNPEKRPSTSKVEKTWVLPEKVDWVEEMVVGA